MKFSLSFAALIALGGQALAVDPGVPYFIADGDSALSGPFDLHFDKIGNEEDQSWYFRSTGNDDALSIVHTYSGVHVSCKESGDACTGSESESPQGFKFIERGQNLYRITNESGDLIIAKRPGRGDIHLVGKAQDDETTVFKLIKGGA